MGDKPAGCQPTCSSMPPRHTVLQVCGGETLGAGTRVTKRGEGKLDATHRPTRLQTRNAGSPVPLSGSSHSINPPFASQAVGSRLKPCLIK